MFRIKLEFDFWTPCSGSIFFPNAQQKGSRFEVGGLAGLDVKSMRNVRKLPQASAVCPQASAAEKRCETQNCRHFWTRVGSSRLQSVNSHRDRWGRGRETQNCSLDLRWIFAFRKRQQSQESGVVVAKRGTVVTFGLALGLRV